jgi:hypothetical protein
MAVTITIDTPADGQGATWDCTTRDGTTTGCVNGSTVSMDEYKKVGMSWSQLESGLATTDDAGDWSATTQGSQFTASGDYKIWAQVMDNATFASDTDENFWTIP